MGHTVCLPPGGDRAVFIKHLQEIQIHLLIDVDVFFNFSVIVIHLLYF